MTEPSDSVLEKAYENVSRSEAGRNQLYEKLMLLIEEDQPYKIEKHIQNHLLILNHPILIGKVIKKRWYVRTIWTAEYLEEREWYLHPPFLFITIYHINKLNLPLWN